MAWEINLCKARLVPYENTPFTSEQLRGFFGYFFMDDEGFHHHGESQKYSYPMVQYKKIGDEVLIIGLGDYAKVLEQRIQDASWIAVPSGTLRIKRMEVKRSKAVVEKKCCRYRFLTPWIALNQGNYNKLRLLSKEKQLPELERILTGNLLSFLKGLGIFIDFRLETHIEDWRETVAKAHGNEFEAFYATFTSNLAIPELVGIGKSVSKGFGALGWVR